MKQLPRALIILILSGATLLSACNPQNGSASRLASSDIGNASLPVPTDPAPGVDRWREAMVTYGKQVCTRLADPAQSAAI